MPAGLGHAIQDLMAAGRLPGLSAAVVRGGEVRLAAVRRDDPLYEIMDLLFDAARRLG